MSVHYYSEFILISRFIARLPVKPVLSGSPQHVELGDISIDQDTSALDAFLESDEVTSESTTGKNMIGNTKF